MATLTVWKFDSARGAQDAQRVLRALSEQQSLVIEDTATVSWPADVAKPTTQHRAGGAGTGALAGAFWGLLFGVIFFAPLLGAAVGAVPGAVAGSLRDVGIDDAFVHRVRDQITPGTSALFLMSTDAVVDRVRDALAGGQPSELLFTTLDEEQEAALRAVFTP